MNIRGKDIWVAGGAGYLGQAIVKQLHAQGAKVLCIDLEDRAAAFVRAAGLTGVHTAGFNLNDTDAIPGFVREQVAAYGSPYGLVNLSFGSTAKTLEELTAEDFDEVNHAGITSTFMLAREAAHYMIENGGGSIVLFSSMYGMVSPNEEVYRYPLNKNPVEYGVGKAGIIQMTKYLAVHWARQHIRCNCISPGPFPSPAVQEQHPDFVERLSKKSPAGRIGTAEEMAGPVAFLLSDDASYITGHNLVVDGGWTSW